MSECKVCGLEMVPPSIHGPGVEECLLRSERDSLRAALSAARGLLKEARDCVALCDFAHCKTTLARIDAFLPAAPQVPEHPAKPRIVDGRVPPPGDPEAALLDKLGLCGCGMKGCPRCYQQLPKGPAPEEVRAAITLAEAVDAYYVPRWETAYIKWTAFLTALSAYRKAREGGRA